VPEISAGPAFDVYRDTVLAPTPRERPDLFSVMVMVDLPIFPGDRQSRRLEEEHAAWTRTGERLERYEKLLIPRARENTEAALNAYQSERGDFTALLRARISELDTRLDALRLRVDRAKARAGLLYLAGDDR
jgi:hypothetical protein